MVFLHYNQYHSFKEIRGTQLDSYTIYLNFERLTLILKQIIIIINNNNFALYIITFNNTIIITRTTPDIH